MNKNHKFIELANNFASVKLQRMISDEKSWDQKENLELRYLNLCSKLNQMETNLLPASNEISLEERVKNYVNYSLFLGENNTKRECNWFFTDEELRKVPNRTDEAILQIPGFLDAWQSWLMGKTEAKMLFEDNSDFWQEKKDSLYGELTKGGEKQVDWTVHYDRNEGGVTITFRIFLKRRVKFDGARITLLKDKPFLQEERDYYKNSDVARGFFSLDLNCYSAVVKMNYGSFVGVTRESYFRHLFIV